MPIGWWWGSGVTSSSADPSALTFGDLYGSQLDIELASSDRTQLFLTVKRKAAVNEGMRAFVRMTDCIVRYGSITVVDGTAEYSLETFADFMRLADDPSIKIVGTSSTRYIQGQDLPRKDTEQLDFEQTGWRALDPGTPNAWYVRDDGGSTYLGLTPPPDVGTGETWTILVPYVATPPDMVNDGDRPWTINGTVKGRFGVYAQGLVHFAAARLESLRKNYAGAQRQMSLFNGYVAMYLQDERGSGPDQITVIRDYLSESIRTPVAMDPRRWP